ncbi:MAG: PQQ-dependent sugar dehydrogenase [Acidobacteria bacterium]|nr:PQQ-dependent sugar dehydrogenase [Acidobacteriota bacterium]
MTPILKSIPGRPSGKYAVRANSGGFCPATIYLSLFLLLCLHTGWLPAAPAPAEEIPSITHEKAYPESMPGWPDAEITLLTNAVNQPVHIAHADDGSGRLFIVERTGTIRIFHNGQILADPFLDISGRITFSGGEQGLLSVAFPPAFAAKQYFYVYYTALETGASIVSRFGVTADPDRADPTSEEIVLIQPQPFTNHNGGQLAFNPVDGYLYIGFGDGGSGGDPDNYAQTTTTWLGKILRIDVESGAAAYAVPADNPFVGDPLVLDEIWAIGLRNPWRFSFDRATGDLWIGDVGQSTWEEINYQPADSPGGENYGWRITEGSACYNPNPCSTVGLTLPVWDYSHITGCSVTGGMVYRGPANSLAHGIYVYGDYCTGIIWGLAWDGQAWVNRELLDTAVNIASFGQDEDGELYVADRFGGIYRLHLTPRYGDANNDGQVDTSDVLSLAAFLGANQASLSAPAGIADVNLDGVINAVDLTILQHRLVDNITQLPHNG